MIGRVDPLSGAAISRSSFPQSRQHSRTDSRSRAAPARLSDRGRRARHPSPWRAEAAAHAGGRRRLRPSPALARGSLPGLHSRRARAFDPVHSARESGMDRLTLERAACRYRARPLLPSAFPERRCATDPRIARQGSSSENTSGWLTSPWMTSGRAVGRSMSGTPHGGESVH